MTTTPSGLAWLRPPRPHDPNEAKPRPTFATTDDGTRLVASSKPVVPFIVVAIVVAVFAGMTWLVIWDANRAASNPPLPGLPSTNDGLGGAELLTLFAFPAIGWILFELWRSRRIHAVFDRSTRQLTVHRYWPLGPIDVRQIAFDDITEVRLGGQLANRGGLISTATVEVSAAGSPNLRLTSWVFFDEANKLQLALHSLLGLG